jgi:hypothetical protein
MCDVKLRKFPGNFQNCKPINKCIFRFFEYLSSWIMFFFILKRETYLHYVSNNCPYPNRANTALSIRNISSFMLYREGNFLQSDSRTKYRKQNTELFIVKEMVVLFTIVIYLDDIKLYTSQLAQIFVEQLSAGLWIFRESKNAYSRIHSLYFCGFVRACNFKITFVFINAKKYVEMLKSYRNCGHKAKSTMEKPWKESVIWWNNFLFTLLIFTYALCTKTVMHSACSIL